MFVWILKIFAFVISPMTFLVVDHMDEQQTITYEDGEQYAVESEITERHTRKAMVLDTLACIVGIFSAFILVMEDYLMLDFGKVIAIIMFECYLIVMLIGSLLDLKIVK